MSHTPPQWRWERDEQERPVRLVSHAEEVPRNVLTISAPWVRGPKHLIASPADLALLASAPEIEYAKRRAIAALQSSLPVPIAINEAISILVGLPSHHQRL